LRKNHRPVEAFFVEDDRLFKGIWKLIFPSALIFLITLRLEKQHLFFDVSFGYNSALLKPERNHTHSERNTARWSKVGFWIGVFA
jgi:hypothetical protein